MHTKKNINCFANSTVDIKEQPVVTKPKKKNMASPCLGMFAMQVCCTYLGRGADTE